MANQIYKQTASSRVSQKAGLFIRLMALEIYAIKLGGSVVIVRPSERRDY
jgi:hypothetical protein